MIAIACVGISCDGLVSDLAVQTAAIRSMTPEQVDLIRKSFDAMWSMRGGIAELCYSRFFELAPDARGLFPTDMERQRVKLMDMIAALVGSLDQRALFQSLVTHSGRQHARFGVRPSHYDAMGEALIWSLDRKFGASFTPELRASWKALYATVQAEMLRSAGQA